MFWKLHIYIYMTSKLLVLGVWSRCPL